MYAWITGCTVQALKCIICVQDRNIHTRAVQNLQNHSITCSMPHTLHPAGVHLDCRHVRLLPQPPDLARSHHQQRNLLCSVPSCLCTPFPSQALQQAAHKLLVYTKLLVRATLVAKPAIAEPLRKVLQRGAV
jgi:hypothetical protein